MRWQSDKAAKQQPDCPDEGVLAAYADGLLEEEERIRAEEHLADCGDCLQQNGLLAQLSRREGELRPVPDEILAKARALSARPASRWRAGYWVPAAAAALLLLAVAPWVAKQVSDTPQQERLLRSSQGITDLQVAAPQPEASLSLPFEVAWKPLPHAVSYSVLVVSSQGEPLWQGQTQRVAITLPADPKLSPGARFFLRVSGQLPGGKEVSSDYIAVVPVNLQNLTARIELLRGLLPRTESQDWEGPAKGLARLLIEPLQAGGWLEGVRRLVLIPHGILHYLPFSALLRSEGDGSRLLVEDFTISYLPSLQRLPAPDGRDSMPIRGVLALMPQSGRLPHAEGEVLEIERLFPGQSDILSGAEARESVFKSRAGRYQTIHLATHSDFHRGNPLKSSLLLEPGDSEDGRLEAGEIGRLRLSADLVVLSACETALGAGYFSPLPPGDDFVSLTRAFLQAGSRSVVASHWKVEDRATSCLIAEFYRRRTSSSNAEALAQAQREMLASQEFAHPFYWAAFALIGE